MAGPPPYLPPADQHFPDLAAYALGSMDPDEIEAFERLISDCPACQEELPKLRATIDSLDGTPAEALLEGPPDDAQFLIRRAVRQIRLQEADQQPSRSRSAPRRRDLLLAAAAVVLVGAGGVVGRQTAPNSPNSPRGFPTSTTASGALPTPVAGTQQATTLDPSTGVRLTVRVVPAAGWVRVTAATSGIKENEQCRLVVLSRTDKQVEAGSWLVSAAGAAGGTTIEAAALVAPADVTAVRVETTAGRVLVTTVV